MGLLLLALAVLIVGSIAVIIALVHRRRELARRDERLLKRATQETVDLTVRVIKGEAPLPGR